MKVGNKLGFKRAFWGFNPAQVHQELAKMMETQKEGVRHYQKQVDNLQAELESIVKKVTELQEQIKHYQGRENLLAETLITAHAEANQIVQDAHQQANELINSAQDEIKQKQLQLQAIGQQQTHFFNEFGNLYHQLQQKCSLLLNPALELVAMSSDVNEDYRPFIPGNLDQEGEGGEIH